MNRLFFMPLVLLMAASVHAAWTPPAKPDARAILTEAQADTKAKRYADALAKHEWFHANALKHDRGQTGVRLSFALSSWKELADAYPPAMKSLKAVRDQADRDVRGGKAAESGFADISAINGYLGDNSKTVELFAWLDANTSGTAKSAYRYAQKPLILSQRYDLCGRYVDAYESSREIIRSYRMTRDMAKTPPFDKDGDLAGFAEKAFANESCTLVALLARTDRKAEAAKVAAEFAKESSDATFLEGLEKAKSGEVPTPWP